MPRFEKGDLIVWTEGHSDVWGKIDRVLYNANQNLVEVQAIPVGAHEGSPIRSFPKGRGFRIPLESERKWWRWLSEKPICNVVTLSKVRQSFHVEFSMVLGNGEDSIKLEAASLELQAIADWIDKRGK
jgi:hypothetical protein